MAKTVPSKFCAIFGLGLNMVAKFGPRGPDVAAIFGPRTDRFGPTLQYLVLLLGTKSGSKILS